MQSQVQRTPKSFNKLKYLQGVVQVQLLSALQRFHQPAQRKANKCFSAQQPQLLIYL